jgi:hypothetical protein
MKFSPCHYHCKRVQCAVVELLIAALTRVSERLTMTQKNCQSEIYLPPLADNAERCFSSRDSSALNEPADKVTKKKICAHSKMKEIRAFDGLLLRAARKAFGTL